jgi:hypothetical protein
MPEARVALDRGTAIRARIAVGVARVLAALPPRFIRGALTMTVRGAGRPSPADVLSWRTAVNSVSVRCASEGCLQRSIAVMLLARSFGVSPTWKTGFRPNPFLAHAWVEVDGNPIGEPAAVLEFRPVLAVAPRFDHEAR